MSLFELPHALDLTLEDDAIARPDGGVALPIDGHDLLARVGGAGQLDFDSIRIVNCGQPPRRAAGNPESAFSPPPTRVATVAHAATTADLR